MTARPVTLTPAETEEHERLVIESASETALRQYMAELIVLRELFVAAKSHNYSRVERTLARLARPSLAFERDIIDAAGESELSPPLPGASERLL